AWYPITPSSSLAEAFSGHCHRLRRNPDTKKKRFAIIQAEDELAAIGIVIGAAWNGARAFTATSGPGISLMQEFIGLAYFAEIPAVIFDIQRGSPSTGMPTRTQQADILSCAYASHGDTKHVLLFPEDPREAFTFAADALDLADRLQTPIFVMLDLDIGMNDWLVEPLAWDEDRRYDRGKVMTEALEALEQRGIHLDTIRIRAFPFHDDILDFIAAHDRIFVIEQNRDAQLRTLLISEGEIDPARLVPILHYDGTPITARFIVKAITDMLSVVTLAPLK